ncbi:MAG: threonine synthase [Candidatus Promineifilaceae bacterium]|nr:threonine synthase [Candidatus Promineifilaceae bacterium]
MDNVLHLSCLLCGETYQPEEVAYVCPLHTAEHESARQNEGILDVRYDYERIAATFSRDQLRENRNMTMWRYRPLLPVAPGAPVPPLDVGWTPLYEAPRLARSLGLRHLWLKDEGRQPTASLKDRASAVVVMRAQAMGARVITAASTGNAAAALSGLCASVGLPAVIFVPVTAPQAKIAQLLVYGATVMLVRGSYDDAFELCLRASDAYGWYNRNTGFNPYTTEGKKTVSHEVCEQMHWEAPDAIFVSVGDGSIIGGVHKGLKDLRALGWIDRMPRLFGVQSSGSDWLVQAWEEQADLMEKGPIQASTVADSISAGLPRDRLKAMAAVRETGGAYLRVPDEEILAAIPTLARGAGLFAEPAGAAAYAGLVQAVEQGLVQKSDRTVVISTGNGLKDIASAMKAAELAQTRSYTLQPDLEDLQRVMTQEVEKLTI